MSLTITNNTGSIILTYTTGEVITIFNDSIRYLYRTGSTVKIVFSNKEEASNSDGTNIISIVYSDVTSPVYASSALLETGLLSMITTNSWSRYTAVESIATTQTISTFGTYSDIGSVIDMQGYTNLLVYVNLDIGGATNFKIKALGQTLVGGGATDEYTFAIETVSASNIKIEDEYIEFTNDSDQLIILKIVTQGVPFIQLQADGGVDGGDDPILTSVKINKIWR